MLVEAVVAIGVAVTILVVIVALSRKAVNNSSQANRQTQATNYAGEMADWLRNQSRENWEIFITKSGIFCMNNLPTDINLWTVGVCSGGTITNTEFTRQITMTPDVVSPVPRTTAKIEIIWQEGSRQQKVVQSAEFYAY